MVKEIIKFFNFKTLLRAFDSVFYYSNFNIGNNSIIT